MNTSVSDDLIQPQQYKIYRCFFLLFKTDNNTTNSLTQLKHSLSRFSHSIWTYNSLLLLLLLLLGYKQWVWVTDLTWVWLWVKVCSYGYGLVWVLVDMGWDLVWLWWFWFENEFGRETGLRICWWFVVWVWLYGFGLVLWYGLSNRFVWVNGYFFFFKWVRVLKWVWVCFGLVWDMFLFGLVWYGWLVLDLWWARKVCVVM